MRYNYWFYRASIPLAFRTNPMNMPKAQRPVFILFVVVAVIIVVLEAVNVFVQGDEPDPIILVIVLGALLTTYLGLSRATGKQGAERPKPPAR